jgi:anti-sigma-K factor RskA
MNRVQFLEEVELYAAHALSPAEMRECDAFLRENADEECRTALRRAQWAWSQLGMSIDPVKPPETVWAAIVRVIGGAHDAPGVRAASRWRERIAWAAVACALLAVGLLEGRRQAAVQRAQQAESRAQQLEALGKAAAQGNETALTSIRAEKDACARALQSAQGDASAKALALAIVQAPGAKMVPLAPQAGASQRATALLDLSGHRAALVASAMSAATDKDYELWIIRDGAKVPAGVIHPDANGLAILALDQALLEGKIDAVAITLEPTGGVPQPTGAILLVAAIKS